MQSDGAYVTYTPTGGADSVTKKLGSIDLNDISSIVFYSRMSGTNGEVMAYSSGKLIAGNYKTNVVTDDLSISMNSSAGITTIKALKKGITIKFYVWDAGYAIPALGNTSTSSEYLKSEIISEEVNEIIYSNSGTANSGIFVVYK